MIKISYWNAAEIVHIAELYGNISLFHAPYLVLGARIIFQCFHSSSTSRVKRLVLSWNPFISSILRLHNNVEGSITRKSIRHRSLFLFSLVVIFVGIFSISKLNNNGTIFKFDAFEWQVPRMILLFNRSSCHLESILSETQSLSFSLVRCDGVSMIRILQTEKKNFRHGQVYFEQRNVFLFKHHNPWPTCPR